MVGLCSPHAGFRYFVAMSAALEALAERDGFEMLQVFSRSDGKAELRRVRMLAGLRVSGLLLLPSAEPQETLDWLARAAIPTVILDRPIDDRRFDQVTLDTRTAMRDVTSRLIGLGHRRLLFMTGNQRLLISQRRIEGIRTAIRASGESVTLRVLERDPRYEDAVSHQITEAMRGVDPPTAIIGTNTTAIGAILSTLRRLGVGVPEQVSVVAADEPEWTGLMQPVLSAIHAPAQLIAAHAWSLLRAAIAGHGDRPRRIAVEAELRLTDSIGPPPARGSAVVLAPRSPAPGEALLQSVLKGSRMRRVGR
jgi:LacI family transcriptional regulator